MQLGSIELYPVAPIKVIESKMGCRMKEATKYTLLRKARPKLRPLTFGKW
jgi:hypothetical protein